MAVVTLIYVAVSLWYGGRSGMSVAFLGCALANLGFIYDLVTKGH